jgi:hypothetical protein
MDKLSVSAASDPLRLLKQALIPTGTLIHSSKDLLVTFLCVILCIRRAPLALLVKNQELP